MQNAATEARRNRSLADEVRDEAEHLCDLYKNDQKARFQAWEKELRLFNDEMRRRLYSQDLSVSIEVLAVPKHGCEVYLNIKKLSGGRSQFVEGAELIINDDLKPDELLEWVCECIRFYAGFDMLECLLRELKSLEKRGSDVFRLQHHKIEKITKLGRIVVNSIIPRERRPYGDEHLPGRNQMVPRPEED